MSDSELPGQLPPRRSRAIRRPAAGTGEPAAPLTGGEAEAPAPRPTPAPRLESGEGQALRGGTPPEAPAPRPEPPGAAAPPPPEAPAPPPPERFTGRSEPAKTSGPPAEKTPGRYTGRSEKELGPSASASRAAFPSKGTPPPEPLPRRSADPLDAARRRPSAAEAAGAGGAGGAPLIPMPEAPPSRSAGPLVAVLAGLALLGGALALAWPSGSPKQLTTVVTPAPAPTTAPVALSQATPEPTVYNPWANGKRPPPRRVPRPVVVVEEPTPEPTPIPEPKPVKKPVTPAQPGDTEAYPQATPKPTPEPPMANGTGYYDPYNDPYYTAPTMPAPVASKSLDLKVTNGVVIGSGEPLKAYSLSLLVHNRSKERVERLRIVLKRGDQSFETTNFSALESGERQELQIAFSGVPKKFHPQRLEVQWSTITGEFVTEKPVSDSSWTKATGGY